MATHKVHTLEQIISKLSSRFNPEAAENLDTTFQFEIEEEGMFYISIKDCNCHVEVGEHEDPNLVIKTDKNTMDAIIAGELDGMSAYLKGRLRAEGNVMLATQLSKLFRRHRS